MEAELAIIQQQKREHEKAVQDVRMNILEEK